MPSVTVERFMCGNGCGKEVIQEDSVVPIGWCDVGWLFRVDVDIKTEKRKYRYDVIPEDEYGEIFCGPACTADWILKKIDKLRAQAMTFAHDVGVGWPDITPKPPTG